MQKKIIQRKLPLNVPYLLESIHRGGIENAVGFCCENCGKMLANYAIVSTKEKRGIIVGLDCLKTLQMANAADAEMEIYCFNKCLQLARLASEATKIEENDWQIWVHYLDKKGRKRVEWETIINLKNTAFMRLFKNSILHHATIEGGLT